MSPELEKTKFKPSCLEISIHGVIKAVEQIKGKTGDFYANTIVIPAESLLDRPTRLVINSRLPLGQEESVIETIAFLRPSYRQSNDKWFFNCSLWNEKSTN